MPSFPVITVRQPRPHDIVDDLVGVCGVGTEFEAQLAARVRGGNGAELAQVPVPLAAHGTLEVYGFHPGTGDEVGKVVAPIDFERALIDSHHGFAQHTVVAGNTLSALAQRFYGDPSQWTRIFEANRDQILNPDLIFPGQTLRIPSSVSAVSRWRKIARQRELRGVKCSRGTLPLFPIEVKGGHP